MICLGTRSVSISTLTFLHPFIFYHLVPAWGYSGCWSLSQQTQGKDRVFIYLLPATWLWPHTSCLACALYQEFSYSNVSHCAVCCFVCHIWHKPGQCPQMLYSGFMPCTRSVATTSLTVMHQPLNPSPYRMVYTVARDIRTLFSRRVII